MESKDEILQFVDGSHMVFITAGIACMQYSAVRINNTSIHYAVCSMRSTHRHSLTVKPQAASAGSIVSVLVTHSQFVCRT
jgi:hypothetical protein